MEHFALTGFIVHLTIGAFFALLVWFEEVRS